MSGPTRARRRGDTGPRRGRPEPPREKRDRPAPDDELPPPLDDLNPPRFSPDAHHEPAGAGLLVGAIGYRNLFWVLAALGAAATALVVGFVPETLETKRAGIGPMGTVSDLSTSP